MNVGDNQRYSYREYSYWITRENEDTYEVSVKVTFGSTPTIGSAPTLEQAAEQAKLYIDELVEKNT